MTGVRLDVDGGVLTATLAEPDTRNALTPTVEAGLVGAYERAAADSDVRCLLLTGTGPAFCAGGNIGEMESNAPGDDLRERARWIPEHLFLPLLELPKPTVAAVNGWAVGAGLALTLACDLRIAAVGARFRLGFQAVGLAPDTGAGWLLPRIVGLPEALRMAMLDPVVAAPDALAMGLVHLVADDLPTEARALAADLAARPTLALGAAKRALHGAADLTAREHVELEIETQLRLLASSDHREGVAAFREGRPPSFEGC